MCGSSTRTLRIEVPSNTREGESYAVKVRIEGDGGYSCSCPGFKFRGTCAHVEDTIEECGWRQGAGPEIQNGRQMQLGICPRCGDKTEVVSFGRSELPEEEQ